MARILISVPEEMLKHIDKVASEECRTRSELLREGFREYLKKKDNEFVGKEI